MLVEPGSYLESLERNPLPSSFSCWQNPGPCSCGSEAPIALLAASQGPLSAPTGGHMHSWSRAMASTFKASNGFAVTV